MKQACAILFSLLVFTAPARADKVDDIVRNVMNDSHTPGVSIAIVKDGKTVKARGYGYANVEVKATATEETVYQLASVTKQFTAVAILRLVEQGKLKLEDSVTTLLPDCPDAWKPVTVRQLLNHTSGIKSYTSVPGFFSANNIRQDLSHSQLLDFVRKYPLEFEPGTKWSYNNTGYFLLGMIIEKVTGKSYDAHLKETVFDPLGMTSTRLNDLRAVIPNRAEGYEYSKSGLRRGEYTSPTHPYSAGALVSSVNDMAKWQVALDSEILLKRSTMDQMWTPTKLTGGDTENYGFGFAVDTKNGHRRINHSGGIPGFSTFTLRLPDDKISIVVLCNMQGAQSEAIANQIAAHYVPDLASKPARAIPDPEPDVTKRVRGIIESIAGGKAREGDFTEAMWKFLQPDRLTEMSEDLGNWGAIKEFTLTGRTAEDNVRRLTYHVVFEKLTVVIRVTLDGDRVAGLSASPD